jgi:hypothetical protein
MDSQRLHSFGDNDDEDDDNRQISITDLIEGDNDADNELDFSFPNNSKRDSDHIEDKIGKSFRNLKLE